MRGLSAPDAWKGVAWLAAAIACGCSGKASVPAEPAEIRAAPAAGAPAGDTRPEARAAPAVRVAEAQPDDADDTATTERPEPLARWDTAYDRPEAVEVAITQTVRAWTGSDLPLPPRCLADLMDARIEVWVDGGDMCWKGNGRGCFFRTATSKRPVIQLQRDEPLADTLPHEALHLLESCAGLWEADHEGPGFSAESHATWLAERRLGQKNMAEIISAGKEGNDL